MRATDVVYFKRFQMELDLARPLPAPSLPAGCAWSAWHPRLLNQHADVKFRSFVGEMDSRIFPCLGQADGCQRVMREITGQRGFLPAATWLVACDGEYVGTVQGVVDGFHTTVGTIQNLGVVPSARGLGIGVALLLKALHGFRQAKLRRVLLEVTAENIIAVRMYRRLGFRRRETLFRAAGEQQSGS